VLQEGFGEAGGREPLRERRCLRGMEVREELERVWLGTGQEEEVIKRSIGV